MSTFVLTEKIRKTLNQINFGVLDISQTETKLHGVISDSRSLDRIILVYTITYCAYLFLFPSYPIDDILRHSVSYRLGYDLRPLYFESYWPSFDPYILFDVVSGVFHLWFGLYGISVIQSIILILTVIALRKLGKDIFSPATFLLYLAICLYISDYLSARPKALVNALFLLSLGYAGLAPLLMLVAVPFYSAFWLYIPPLIVYHYKRKTTVLLLGIVLCSGLLFWLVYGGADYVNFIWKLVNIRKLRVAGLDMTENISIMRGMAVYLFLFYPYFFYAMKEKMSFFSGLYFMALNQVRFLPSLAPIALRFFRFEEGRNLIRLPSIFVLIFLFMIPNFKDVPLPETAQGAIQSVKEVFADIDVDDSNQSTSIRILGAPYFNFAFTYLYGGKKGKQKIKIAPPPEVGFLNPDLQGSIKEPNCRTLHHYNIDYYVSSAISKVDENAHKCLKLVKTSRKFNLYEVQKYREARKWEDQYLL